MEGFFSGVKALVRPQVSQLTEALITLGATEGFLPAVKPLVCLQVARQAEALVTLGTAEGFCSSVDMLVSVQSTQMSETLVTLFADVLSPLSVSWPVYLCFAWFRQSLGRLLLMVVRRWFGCIAHPLDLSGP